MKLDMEVGVSTRVVSYPIANPTHNACAEELRVVFRHVFGDDIAKWPPWADHEIYYLAQKLSSHASAMAWNPFALKCLCVPGNSVNGRCPFHGDEAQRNAINNPAYVPHGGPTLARYDVDRAVRGCIAWFTGGGHLGHEKEIKVDPDTCTVRGRCHSCGTSRTF